MALVTVDMLKPGMEVAEDVLNSNGMLLLPGGARLTEQSIRVLKSCGVERLRIAGGDAGFPLEVSPNPPDPARVQDSERELTVRFQHVNESMPAAQIIRRISFDRLTRRLSRRHSEGST